MPFSINKLIDIDRIHNTSSFIFKLNNFNSTDLPILDSIICVLYVSSSSIISVVNDNSSYCLQQCLNPQLYYCTLAISRSKIDMEGEEEPIFKKNCNAGHRK